MIAAVAALTAGALGLAGCGRKKAGEDGGSTSSSSRESQVLAQAFEAIKNNDWASYQSLTLTTADIMMQRNKVSAFQQSQTYAGGVLKKEEIARQEAEFHKAVEGGPGRIDFAAAQFAGPGRLIDSGSAELLEGGSYNYWMYSLRLKVDGVEIDSAELQPLFVLADGGSGPKIISLIFAPEENP
jgi:hypothetical protein